MVDLTLPDATPAPDMGDASGRLVARVQAWQHRHPLARRLPAADVTGLGVIALPYGPAEAGGQPQPLFHQPSLVPGLSHRALVDFAQRHAVSYRPGPADWPQRAVERADASPDPAPETRYLLTAAVTEPVAPGALPRRLLLAPEGSAIWGARPLSRPRVLAAAGGLLLVLAVAGWWLRAQWLGRASVPPVPSVVPAASAVAVVPAPSAAMPASAVASAVATVPAKAASAPVSSPVAAPLVAVSTPAHVVAPSAARVASAVAAAPILAPPASVPKAPASAAASAVSPSASAVAAPPPKLLPMPTLRSSPPVAAPTDAVPAPSPAASVAVPAGPHFALVSPPSKKRGEAEAMLAQIHKLLGPAIGQLQAQIMPSPEGFVVTIWPLPTQPDAERLAEVLARRGVPMKWLEF